MDNSRFGVVLKEEMKRNHIGVAMFMKECRIKNAYFYKILRGDGSFRLSYYHEIMLAFDVFVNDEEERLRIRRRLGEALGMFKVLYRVPREEKGKRAKG